MNEIQKTNQRMIRSWLKNEICFFVMRRRLKDQGRYRKELDALDDEQLVEEYEKITGKKFKQKKDAAA